MVDGQIQKPRLGQGHKEKLGIGLMQLGQDLGEELMKRKGVSPHVLSWQRKGVYHLHLGTWG